MWLGTIIELILVPVLERETKPAGLQVPGPF
jgi:hypothetical protein